MSIYILITSLYYPYFVIIMSFFYHYKRKSCIIMIPLELITQSVGWHNFIIITHYFVIFTKRTVFTHYYEFLSPK